MLREFDLFTHVRQYIQAHPQLTADQRRTLLEAVRYRWFSTEELIEAMQEGLVPESLLLEATFAVMRRALSRFGPFVMTRTHVFAQRLSQYEPSSAAAAAAEIPLRLQPRPLYPLVLRSVARAHSRV